MSTTAGPARTIRFVASPNRIVATVFGAVYALVGLLGFFWTAGVPFAGPGNGSSNLILGIFEVNPLHNVAHLLIGIALLIAGTRTPRRRRRPTPRSGPSTCCSASSGSSSRRTTTRR